LPLIFLIRREISSRREKVRELNIKNGQSISRIRELGPISTGMKKQELAERRLRDFETKHGIEKDSTMEDSSVSAMKVLKEGHERRKSSARVRRQYVEKALERSPLGPSLDSSLKIDEEIKRERESAGRSSSEAKRIKGDINKARHNLKMVSSQRIKAQADRDSFPRRAMGVTKGVVKEGYKAVRSSNMQNAAFSLMAFRSAYENISNLIDGENPDGSPMSSTELINEAFSAVVNTGYGFKNLYPNSLQNIPKKGLTTLPFRLANKVGGTVTALALGQGAFNTVYGFRNDDGRQKAKGVTQLTTAALYSPAIRKKLTPNFLKGMFSGKAVTKATGLGKSLGSGAMLTGMIGELVGGMIAKKGLEKDNDYLTGLGTVVGSTGKFMASAGMGFLPMLIGVAGEAASLYFDDEYREKEYDLYSTMTNSHIVLDLLLKNTACTDYSVTP
jgi:hypothetical protein